MYCVLSVNVSQCYEKGDEYFFAAEVAAVLIIAFYVMLIVGYVGNTLVVYVITVNKDMHTTTNQLLLSLAVTDILQLSSHSAYCVGNMWNAYRGDPIGCQVVEYFGFVGISMTAYTLLSVSIVRYIVIAHPHRAKTLITTKSVRILIAVVWIVVTTTGIPIQVLITCRYDYPAPNLTTEIFHYCSAIFSYIIPITLITIFSVMTHRVLSRPSLAANKKSDDAKRRASRMMLVVCGVFAASLFLYSLVFVLSESLYSILPEEVFLNIIFFSIILNVSNSCLNPIIYCFTSTQFRGHFLETLCVFRRKLLPQQTTTISDAGDG